jgi:hypothetical protein
MRDREKNMTQALGINIGGTGIKAAIFDVKSGALPIERTNGPTPESGQLENLSWEAWPQRLHTHYSQLKALFVPNLFIFGEGVSTQYKQRTPLLILSTAIVPAVRRNNAGILGASSLAAHGRPAQTGQDLR